MNSQLTGIILIAFCGFGYYYSWGCQSKGNFIVAIFLLIICGLALRVFAASDLFLHPWDERFHALVAKNLLKHPFLPTLYDTPVLPFDYRVWAANHVWLHKQPLPLWAMAASMWLFGVNEIALRLPSIILTSVGIALTFSITKYLFNNKTAYLAAFFYSLNGLVIEMTSGRIATDHVEVFFLFFVELAIFFAVLFARHKKTVYNILCGISIGLAVLSKWLPAYVVLPVWILLVVDTGNFKRQAIIWQFILLVAVSICVFIPWQLYIYHTFPLEANWEAGFNYRHITTVLEGHSGPFYYYLDCIRMNYGELIYLPLLWFTWKAFIPTLNLKRLLLCTWFWTPCLFFSFAQTKMQGYILFTAPALFIMTADYWYMLQEYKTNKSKSVKWIVTLLLILFIALPVRYAIERVKPFSATDRNPQWALNLKKLNEDNYKRGVLFNYDKPIEAMFHTNLTAYSYLPPARIIDSLLNKGYTVIINDSINAPKEVKSMKGIVWKNL